MFFGLNAYSQQVETKVNASEILIGDYIELTYILKDDQSRYSPKIDDSTLKPFRFIALKKVDTLYSAQTKEYKYNYIISCYEDSVQTIPSQPFVSLNSDTIFGAAMTIKVNLVAIDSTEKDIKPIKPTIALPLSREELFSYLLMSLLVLAIVILGFWAYMKFIAKQKFSTKIEKEEKIHVVALTQLKELENSDLLNKDVKAYYQRLTDIMRQYIEKRFGFNATEMLSHDIVTTLGALELSNDILTTCQSTFELADLAKFAREKHDSTKNREILSLTYEFIQKTQGISDINQQANVKVVKKFYSVNRYLLLSAYQNQQLIKVMILGMLSSFACIALLLIIGYTFELYIVLNFVANYPIWYFVGMAVLGSIITLGFFAYIRAKMASYEVVFDFSQLIFRKSPIFYSEIKEIQASKKGLDIYLKDQKKITIHPYTEHYDEVQERLFDIQQQNQMTN
jgi:hypothetical protein